MTDNKNEDIEDQSACSEALTETRRVIDVQIEMIENTDTEIISLMRLNILGLGGVVTLIAYLPELISESIFWVALAVLWFVSSVLIAAFIYRGVTIYAGYGDHGDDSNAPKEKLQYEALIGESDAISDPSGFSKDSTLSSDSFTMAVLSEHQTGISHNNIEIKYRSQIHQQVIQLLLIGILTLGIGLSVGIVDPSGIYVMVISGVATFGITGVAIYTIIKSLGLIGRFIQTQADPNRLSYGYAFKRQYPYLSKICLFVLTYLYDPADGDW
jgi:hypothetical protein